jgi:hypothetical protein
MIYGCFSMHTGGGEEWGVESGPWEVASGSEEQVMRVSIIVLILMVSLASCARMQPVHDKYIPQSFPHSARLYLDLPPHVNVNFFSDEKCTLGEHGTFMVYDYYGGGEVVDGYRPRNAFEEKMQSVNIEANKPQVINLTLEEKVVDPYKGVQMIALCSFTYWFTPQENHNYVALYELKNNNCSATIMDLTQSHFSNQYVKAAGLRPAAKNCDIYEYYFQPRTRDHLKKPG